MKTTTKQFRNKDVQAFYDDCTNNLDLVIQRIEWLLDGDYGYDEMMEISTILKIHPRMNVNAVIFQRIAKYEWQLTQAQANRVYNALTTEIQHLLNYAIDGYITESEAYARS